MAKEPPYSLFICTGLIALFVVLGAIFTEPFGVAFGHIQTFIVRTFGWAYVLAAVFFLIFVIWLMFSSFGRVRLGRDDEKPEYGYLTWFAMLFCAGMGIGLIFFSVAEPMSHFSQPPRAAPQTVEAASDAMVITFFHWGLHAWAIYVVVGVSLAYFAYRHGLPLTIRSTLYPLLGERVHGPVGSAVDILAVFGTVFGLATSLGLGAMQVSAGMEYLGIVEASTRMQIALIVVITLIATISVATGLNKGIRRLSQLNVVLVLLMIMFLGGPTIFLLSSYVQNIGAYAASLIELSFNTDAYIGTAWQEAWTMFYWGWWISWSPFVGMFIARISKGRTIREFVIGVLLAPALVIFFWMVAFGNTAIHLELANGGQLVEAVGEDISTVIFVMFEQLPLSMLSAILAIIVIAVFFVTSADSGSLVVNILTAGGDPDPPMSRRAVGAIMIGAVAAVLLLSGGLVALQTAAITTAMPFSLIMLVMCYALVKSRLAERSLRQSVSDSAEAPVDTDSTEKQEQSVPLAGATPGDGYTGTLPLSLAAAERQEDWRKRLQYVIQGYERYKRAMETQRAEAQPQLLAFIEQTVLPAFEQIKAELQGHDRSAVIESDADRATLTVQRDGEQEFSFAIHGSIRAPLTFAFPEVTAEGSDVKTRAEIILSAGRHGEYDVEELTREKIIEEFITAYARWMGW
jgi:choline/glycine/proline betaine transport protein